MSTAGWAIVISAVSLALSGLNVWLDRKVRRMRRSGR